MTDEKSFIRRIPGFRSGTWWKMGLAVLGYGFIILLIIGLLVPGESPTATTSIITPTPPSPLTTPVSKSNHDEELRSALGKSSTEVAAAVLQTSRDATNNDYAALIQSGKALEIEAEIWYNRINVIDDISPEWQSVKMNQLKALDYYRLSGQKISKAGLAYQIGDYTAAIAYTQDASADMQSGTRYTEEATSAIPK